MNPAGWLFLSLVGVLLFVFDPFLGNAFTLKNGLGILTVGILLGSLSLEKTFRWYLGRFEWVALAFLSCAAWSVYGAGNRGAAFHGLILLASYILILIVASNGALSDRYKEKFGTALGWFAIPVGGLAIAQYFLPERLDFGLQALGKMRAFSTLGNPNFVAAFLVLVIPIFLDRFLVVSGLKNRLMAGGWVLFLMGSLAVTQSKSGWIAFCLIAVLFAVDRSRTVQMRFISAIALSVVAVLAIISGFATHTGRGRLLLWRESFEMFKSNPWFGVGLGDFNLHQWEAQGKVFGNPDWVVKYLHNAAFVMDAHCEGLNILTECGLLTCLFWLILMAMIARRGWRRMKFDGSWRGLYFGWVGLLFFGLWNVTLFVAPLGILFYLSSGWLGRPVEPNRELRAPVNRWVVIAIACSWVVLGGWWTRDTFLSGRAEYMGNALLETGPFDEAVGFFDVAIRYQPFEGYLHEKKALALYFEGRRSEALAELKIAEKLYGDIGIPYLEGEILAREKRYEEAAVLFERIATAFPNHLTPPFMLGQIYDLMGRKAEARQKFERVLEIPQSPYNLKSDHGHPKIMKDFAKGWLSRNS